MTTTTTKPQCPTGPQGQHDRYSDGTCAYCRAGAPSPHEQALAYRQGEADAYHRVLALLATLADPEPHDLVLLLAQDVGVRV